MRQHSQTRTETTDANGHYQLDLKAGVSDQCTKKDPKVLQSYLNQLQGVATGMAINKVVGNTTAGVIDQLVAFHSALAPVVKASRPDVWKAYQTYAMAAYNSVSSVIRNCLQLSTVPAASACVATVSKSLKRLYAVTFSI